MDTRSEKLEGLSKAATRRMLALRAQLDAMRDFVGHNGEVGRANEQILRDAIRPLLSSAAAIGSGFVKCHEGTTSQQDIVVYRKDGDPPLFQIDDIVVVDSTTAMAVLEVKTNKHRQHEGCRDSVVQNSAEVFGEFPGRHVCLSRPFSGCVRAEFLRCRDGGVWRRSAKDSRPPA